jgi:hypothetical protein
MSLYNIISGRELKGEAFIGVHLRHIGPAVEPTEAPRFAAISAPKTRRGFVVLDGGRA